MTPLRRHDDPSPAVTAEQADAFIAGLPQAIDELEKGRRQNRRIAEIARAGLLVVVPLAVFFGWVLQSQNADIERAAQRDRQDAYVQCRLVNDNALALNQFIDRIVASVRTADGLSESEKAWRIKQYLAIKQQLPVCRRP